MTLNYLMRLEPCCKRWVPLFAVVVASAWMDGGVVAVAAISVAVGAAAAAAAEMRNTKKQRMKYLVQSIRVGDEVDRRIVAAMVAAAEAVVDSYCYCYYCYCFSHTAAVAAVVAAVE